MTRFARAKGSKASNERLPEESTPWATMKQQLLENNNNSRNEEKKKEMNELKMANYNTFLKEKEAEQSKHAVWASFPVQRNKSLLLNHKTKKRLKDKTSVKINNDTINKGPSKVKTKIVAKKLKLVSHVEKNVIGKVDIACNLNNDMKKIATIQTVTSVKKMERSNYQGKEQGNIQNVDDRENDKNKKGQKRKKNDIRAINKKLKNTKKEKAELSESDLKKIEKKKQKRIKQLLKKKQFKEKLKEQVDQKTRTNPKEEVNCDEKQNITGESDAVKTGVDKKFIEKNIKNPLKSEKKYKNKILDNNHHARRKPTLPHKMFINGKELEIAYVEGFPVKKEDADRLKKLRKEMISKGLPRSQIDAALKLERRKAEKALAREKKKVCFNCRKSGHNLSECPELGKDQLVETTGSGICFKCGSTEHTHFECKVVRGLEYKFAQCFICQEQGHIARQYPDNARGLYPKGGACKVCGDVTHLKKDCPQYQAHQEKQENSLRIHTLGDGNPEVLDSAIGNKGFTTATKQNKIIKFV